MTCGPDVVSYFSAFTPPTILNAHAHAENAVWFTRHDCCGPGVIISHFMIGHGIVILILVK